MMNAVETMSEVSENPRELLMVSQKDESSGVRVSLRDSGPGLDPESLNHIFTAFYTTKPQGIGMGLASNLPLDCRGARREPVGDSE